MPDFFLAAGTLKSPAARSAPSLSAFAEVTAQNAFHPVNSVRPGHRVCADRRFAVTPWRVSKPAAHSQGLIRGIKGMVRFRIGDDLGWRPFPTDPIHQRRTERGRCPVVRFADENGQRDMGSPVDILFGRPAARIEGDGHTEIVCETGRLGPRPCIDS